MHILFVLQTAFSIWMLVDAIRRRAPEYWWIIVLVPFGEWVYFFAVKLPDTQFRPRLLRKLFVKRASLSELRAVLTQTPSHVNRVNLAQKLHDEGHYQEAADLFEKVLRRDEDDKASLYGYALCCERIGKHGIAIRALERLVDIDDSYEDYAPCEDLARLYQMQDDQTAEDGRDRAISLLRKACKRSQRINPRLILAKYLTEAKLHDEAREWLEDGLTAYASSPAYVRRRDRRDARKARALLRSLR